MFHGYPLWLNLNLNRKTAPSLVLGRCKVAGAFQKIVVKTAPYVFILFGRFLGEACGHF